MNMQIEPHGPPPGLDHPVISTRRPALPTGDAQKISQSAQQFEAMLVRQVLAGTFKATPAVPGRPAAPGSDIYDGFVTDIVADNISQGDSLGISHLLQSQFDDGGQTAATSRPDHP